MIIGEAGLVELVAEAVVELISCGSIGVSVGGLTGSLSSHHQWLK